MSELSAAPPFSRWERLLAFRYLRARRKQGGVALITLISFFGITLAVIALIVVMSIMNGFRAEMLDQLLGFKGHVFFTGQVTNDGEREALEARLRQAPHVVRVTSVTRDTALLHGADTTGATIIGISPQALAQIDVVTQNIREGSLRDFGEGEYGGELIVVGGDLAAAMGVRVGDPLTIISPGASATAFGSAPVRKVYTVGAVFYVGMPEFDRGYVYMPLEQAQLLFGKEGGVDEVELLVDNPDRLDDYLPAIRRAGGPSAEMSDWRDRDTALWGALKVERSAMRLVMMFIILIAALNIISGLVMLVKNKGRDIAILRTVGAGQGAIMRVFLMSGAAIGLIATPIGVAIGVLFSLYIEPIQIFVENLTGARALGSTQVALEHVPAKVDWGEVAFVVAWTLGVSLAVTLWPARRAGGIDPVEALRYE